MKGVVLSDHTGLDGDKYGSTSVNNAPDNLDGRGYCLFRNPAHVLRLSVD